MYLMRTICALSLVVMITACGGGGSLTKSGGSVGDGGSSGGGGTGGGGTPTTPDPTTPVPVVWSMSMTMTDQTGQQIRNVSQAEPGTLQATLLKDNSPVAFEVVTFTTESTGSLNPSLGTALTNAEGIASITLLPGTEAGAGRAVATYITEDSEDVSATYSFTSAGDAPQSGGDTAFTLNLQIISGVSQSPVTQVSAAEPVLVVATATSIEGVPVENRVVTFTSTLGAFRPNVGTALTDSDGVATILLTAGTIEGAGEVTAAFEAIEAKAGFYTQGDEVDPDQVVADVDFQILSCPENWDRITRNPALCSATQNIDASSPGILYIDVKKAGSTIPLGSTLVSAETSIGRISPETGTAITNENGIALLDLLAGSDVGAGEVDITAVTTTVKKAFEIGAANVSLQIDNGLDDGQSLSAGATTVVSVSIVGSDGSPWLPPLDVEFTSNCSVSTPPLAQLDSRVTSIGGIARATYRADGCVGADTITATVITGGDARSITTTVDVTEANTGSIEFIGVSDSFLALRSTGGAGRTETSTVQFRVVDENGNPDPQEFVRFSLTTDVGGLTLDPVEAFSNNEGIVQTVVRSGDIPGAVRVIAVHEAEDGNPDNHQNRISAVSDQLIISTGIPDNNSFTLAPAVLNPEGLLFDNTTMDVTVFMADHFNNPVPDGTSVFLTTEGGAIEPGCETTNGRCTVEWRSQNPRPFSDFDSQTGYRYSNAISDKCDRYFGAPAPCTRGIVNPDSTPDRPLGGRATILAYAIGEESFTDLNSNGVFDEGEFYQQYDLPEAFIDHNENNQFDGISCADPSNPCAPANSDGGEFEEYVDFNNDGSFSLADNMYNGLLCSEAAQQAGACRWETTHVRRNIAITMSGSTAYMRLRTVDPGTNCADLIVNSTVVLGLEASDVAGQCDINSVNISDLGAGSVASVTFILSFSDIFNNPLPAGTELTVATSNGVLAGTTSLTVPSTNSAVPASIAFSISRESVGNSVNSGTLTINVETPREIVSSLSIPVLDDR